MSASCADLATTNTRPTWAEIDLSALRHNYRTLVSHVAPRTFVCAVVKCNAYGHGAIECAQALEAEGAKWFAVTNPSEGVVLRRAGIKGRILLLSGFWQGEEEIVLSHDLTPAVWSDAHLDALEAAARRTGANRIPIHLKVDTGMSRLGVRESELPGFLAKFGDAERLEMEGFWSHLASSEVVDAPSVEAQIAGFERASELLAETGIRPKFRHLANSAAIATRPSTWYDMVRAGISLYGHHLPLSHSNPSLPDQSLPFELEPVLSWKTRVIDVRCVPAGQGVGYGLNYTTRQPSRLAVLPVGYGDGYLRALSSRGRVLVRGEYAPIAGNVSMDVTVVDVTHIPGVAAGDTVTLVGNDGEKSIELEELARHYGTISYEVMCGITKRVPRKYVGEEAR